ncbi:proline rich transmembrane protein 1B-like [Xenopus tropicalis]|uniref:Proline rich transmembrane protein 1B-like n=1 Tax=Xenopus tropicalis TaxID=8364 RepID=A0A8J1K0G1_XENTR|nr:proline rich transmembrane protein 1B-like [Xenopus tropicalis]
MYPPSTQNPTMDFQGAYSNQIPMARNPIHAAPPANVSQTFPEPQTVVINTQSIAVMPTQPVCKDYMGCSIANLLCCCFPIGIAALIFSIKTRDDISRGDMITAASDSRTAFTLNMVALGLGLVANLVWISYTIYALDMYGSPDSSTPGSSTPYEYYG